tara:strand:+ start:753 stop:956 length:204 start_codon:yes stop_codon:yes gene_type:complete
MTYPTIELFSKMVKNSKNLRQKELRLSSDQAVELLSEITQVLTKSKQNSDDKPKAPVTVNFDAGGFK